MSIRTTTCAIAVSLTLSQAALAADSATDPVVLSFATVGDSRQDPANPDPTTLDPVTKALSGQDAIWLQNTRVWSRMMREIQKQAPNFLFFNGDMIMGYGKASLPADTTTVGNIVSSDLMQFYRQYGFWRGMVANLMETGTYVVPVPGNHETQWKAGGKIAVVENENAWRDNMGDLILDTQRMQNLFGKGPDASDITDHAKLDGLTTDQSKLSYSFDFGDNHFAIINTDATGFDAKAPVGWLESDLAAASARGAKHVFVFGHKPAFTYYYGTATALPTSPSGLDKSTDLTNRDQFWSLIEKYNATYFCGHEHIYNAMQPVKTDGKPSKNWQVIVGSGGSPFEAKTTDVTKNPATDRSYAWALVKVYKSGRVTATINGFNDKMEKTQPYKWLQLP